MISTSTTTKYIIQNIHISLRQHPEVFPPSPHGLFFANNIEINKNEEVIDIGTGSGVLAILAAKMGGRVSATDNNAISVEMARKNAVLNNVKVDCREGEYFAQFDKKFDVILANLPQKMIFEQQSDPGVFGGKSGNEVLLNFLEKVKNHMKSTTRVYIFIYTLTDFIESLNYITKNFNSKLIALKRFPEAIVERDTPRYLQLNQIGKIHISQMGDKYGAIEYFFELTLK